MKLKHYRIGLLVAFTMFANQVGAEKAYLNVEIDDGLLIMSARDVTVEQVVEAIGQRSGIQLVLHKPLDERISLAFDRVPFPQAISRLLRGEDYALQCDQPLCRSVELSDRVQGTLWVFSDRTGDTYARNVPVTKPVDIHSESEADASIAALADHNALVREDAVDVIAEIKGERAIPLLEQALQDKDAAVREAAIASLTDIGSDSAARALGTVLNDENVSLREDAVDALGDIGGKAATQLLQQALLDEKSVIREAAAEILAEQMERP